MNRLVAVSIAAAISAPLGGVGCSLTMSTNPSGWTPSQPTACSSSPGKPILDVGLGVMLSNAEVWAGIPAFISAVYGFVQAASCASDKGKRKRWLDSEESPIFASSGLDDEEDDEPAGNEAVERMLADERRAAEKRRAPPPPPRASACAAHLEQWSAERDLRRNAAIYGRMPEACQREALARRQQEKLERERAERAAWEEKALAARSAFAVRKRIAAELARSDDEAGDDSEEELERRAWQSMTADARRAWTELAPAQRKRVKERVLSTYVATATARDQRAARAAIETRAWAALTAEERSAWRTAPAEERVRLKQRAVERAEKLAAERATKQQREELDRRHREAMNDSERRAWDAMSEQERLLGRARELTETAEWKAEKARRDAADAEWTRLAKEASERRTAEEEERRQEVAAETERARAAQAEASEKRRRAAEAARKAAEEEQAWLRKVEEEEAKKRAKEEARRQRVEEVERKRAEAAERKRAEEAERKRVAEAKRKRAEEERARKAEAGQGERPAKPGELGGYCLVGDECKGDLICDPDTNRCVGQDPGAPIRVEPKQPVVGYFIANTKPTARVWIDNRDTKLSTPISPADKLSLKPGKHSVTFVTTDRMFTFEFTIEAGKTTKMIKLLPVGD